MYILSFTRDFPKTELSPSSGELIVAILLMMGTWLPETCRE